MAKKRGLNTRGGLIDSPEAYLRACTGRSFHRADGFRVEDDFALRQSEYESADGRALPNCTLAALVNALGHYRARFPQIPESPAACYALLRPHVRLVQSPVAGLGGYPAVLNAVLVRRLWRLLGVDAYPAVYPFPSARTLRRQAERGEPAVLSVWTRAYRGHTVLLLGWELWTDGKTPRLFWVVRDGWQRAPRYLDAESGLHYQLIRMVK